MSERYTRLFALEENLYSDGSLVVISAGALLKDNQTGAVLAQLKIRNIGGKTIKAAAVRITCFDTVGKPLEGTAEKEYLDLTAGRDEEFGQKSLVSLPDTSARSFSVAVTWVAFSDNTVWNASGEALSALPKPDSLSEVLGDEELVKQYRLKYGAGTKSFPRKHKDLWFCACGALNRADEEACHVCGQKLAAILPFDAEALKAEKDARLQREADERRRAEKEAKAAAAEKAKKSKKTVMIVTPIICVCIAFVILLTQVIIPKQKLNKAVSLIDAGEYDSAYALLEEIGNEKLESIYYKALFADAAVGDTIVLGSYEQDNDISNGKEYIEWLVLAIEDNRLLVISRYALDCRQYSTEPITTWEKCTLRGWLNNDFFRAAFSDREKTMIPTVTVSADKNPDYDTDPGSATQDKVFLLSITEANRYLKNDEARMCTPTDYAIANGVCTSSSYTKDGAATRWWWLRSPGSTQSYAALIYDGNEVGSLGGLVYSDGVTVRPAMWIDLSN